MNNYILILFTLVLSINVEAQQNTTKDHYIETKTDYKPVRQIRTESFAVQMPVYNENDEYYGRKEEFTFMFISGVLPDDFPKYKLGSNGDDYNNVIVYNYLKQHANELTEKVKPKYEQE